ncbi:MAG: creatininase family protein [Pseudorhodoplanes sp.]
MKLKSRYWWDLTTRDFAALDMRRVIALQPIAAVEQHGPHLPLRVDAAINEGIVAQALAQMPDELPVLVLPPCPIGKSDEHLAFPGTLTLSHETLARLWFEIGESVNRAGCRKILFYNSHGGNPPVMDIVARDLRVKLSMLAVTASWFVSIDTADLFGAAERRHGIHGGEEETSMMLHLQRGLVEMEQAADFAPASAAMPKDYTLLTAEGPVAFAWMTQDLHPSGACGNAAAADAEKGRAVVTRAAAALVALLQDMDRFPLQNLHAEGAFRPR